MDYQIRPLTLAVNQLDWHKAAQRFSATVAHDASALGVAHPAVSEKAQLVDVRKAQAYADARDLLVGATWRDPARLPAWAGELDLERPVVVYCRHGMEVSQAAALSLRARGYEASYLVGGIEACRDAGAAMSLKP